MRIATLVTLVLLAPSALGGQAADLILTGGRIWTGDPTRPWADAVALAGDRILAVGGDAEVLRHRSSATRVRPLGGAFVAPGFMDNHTHFSRAGELLLGVNLLDVADEAGLARRVLEARERMPEGAWLVGGDWGAYEAWAMGSTGAAAAPEAQPFRPHRAMIDSLTTGTPALLSRWDRTAFLANEAALRAAGAVCAWEGVDCEGGIPTGRLDERAAARVRRAMPPKGMEQRLAEARLALADLARNGVTTIHDITPPEQFEVYRRLGERGELTVRVYARPTLDKVEELAAVGLRHGFGDEWIKVGGLKGFVDGIMGNSSARFYEPYLTAGVRGSWRTMMTEPPGMRPLLETADSSGHWPQVHAIGDAAIDTLLDMYDAILGRHPDEPIVTVPGTSARLRQDRRWRVIHTQVLRDASVAERMARLGVIAEVQPYHAIDDMRWMEERIGERSRWAYAFRTLEEAGVLLTFGSDWPGTNASWYPASPVLGIYAAVTRQTLDGEPAGGWYPEERIGVETALRAYTVNAAWSAGEEDRKGRIAPGLLADLTVLDRSPFEVTPERLKELEVLLTVVGGRVVYERPTT